MKVAKKTSTSFILIIAMGVIASGQTSSSARAEGMGDIGVTLKGPIALLHNPAGFSGQKSISFALSTTMPFGISELSHYTLAIGISLRKSQAVYGAIRSTGFSEYRQAAVTTGYTIGLLKDLSLTAGMGVSMLYIRSYGTSYDLIYFLGIQYQLSKTLTMGFLARNPISISTSTRTPVEFDFIAGIGYSVSPLVSMYAEYALRFTSSGRPKVGLEYRVNDHLSLRFGSSFRPSMIHFGASLSMQNALTFDMAMSYSTLLGLTPSLGVTFVNKHHENITRHRNPG